MNVETLLEEALRARTGGRPLDPFSLDRIAKQLARPGAAPATHPRRRLAMFATAAAVVVVAALTSGLLAWSSDRNDGLQTGGSAVHGVPGYPVPSGDYFLAQARPPASTSDGVDPSGGISEVIRASDGDVVAILPSVDGQALIQPVLSNDGRRVYAVWGSTAGTLGFIDTQTGKVTELIHRTGTISSPTVSADGSTLAYEWTPKLDGHSVSSVVVHDVATGVERVLPNAPAGPVALSLALSPDGGELAVVPDDNGGSPGDNSEPQQPLWVVSTTGADAFDHPDVIGFSRSGCSADQPKWGTHGLFLVERCTGPDGTDPGRALARVDLNAQRLDVIHAVPVNPFPRLTVLDRTRGPLFVVADIATVGEETVTVFDPDDGWKATELPGLVGLPG